MSIFDFFKNGKKPTGGHKQQSATPEKETPTSESKKNEAKPSERKTTDPEGARRVHNLIILDESGSMTSIYYPALTGVNETLQTIREARKEHDNQEHYVSLIAFDSNHYNQIYKNTPAEKAIDINEQQYRPGGCTPLYDAMGRAITDLRQKVGKDDVVLVTVITDGYENASCEYSGAAIKRLVETMKKEGWVFTYIGANQDVEAVGASLSIDNKLAFAATEESTHVMFAKERSSRKRFFASIGDVAQMDELRSGAFFNDLDKDEKDNKS